jgi:hypothetical protein
VSVMSWKKGVGDGDSSTQKHTHGTLSDSVRATKKSSTPVASVTTVEKGVVDKDMGHLWSQDIGHLYLQVIGDLSIFTI